MMRSYFAGIQLRQAPNWGGEANAGILLLVSRMGHQGAGDAAVAEVANQEAAARKSQRDAKTSIEECDEPRGGNARRTQPNAHGHHERHNEVALGIEEPPERHTIFFHSFNTAGMLANQLGKHSCMEHREGNDCSMSRTKTFFCA